MHWFKHLTRARHDPFIFDLRQAFGAVGYWVYFATLEIYAESYQPKPGWFLNVSMDFMKSELGFYHAAKMKKIFDYIRQWPDQTNRPAPCAADPQEMPEQCRPDPAESLQAMAMTHPKWIVNLTGNRVKLIIPSFSKIMDEYTRKRARMLGEITGQGPDNAAGSKSEDNQQTRVALIMSEIARHCEALAELPEKKGRAFPGPAFVGCCIKEGLHPGAIRDGTDYLIHKAKKLEWDNITDPFGMARGVAKSRNQYYAAFPVDLKMVRAVYGKFFNG